MANLVRGQLTFVHHDFVGEGSDIEADAVFPDRVIDDMAAMVAEDEEFPLKGHWIIDVIGTGDEYLFHFGFHGQGGGADAFRIHRDFTPG